MKTHYTPSANSSDETPLSLLSSSPMVSVCMITYNQEAYIEQALYSVLAQKTNFDFEVVIGEDASKDNTRDICESFAREYPHLIHLLDTPHNFGVVPNLIRTMKACKGRYIALLEGDDYWIDEYKLQKQIDQLERDKFMTISFTGRKNYEETTKKFIDVDEDRHGNRFGLKDFAKNTYFHTSTVVFRLPVSDQWLNRLTHPSIGDRPLYLSLLKETGGYAHKLPDVCSVFRINEGSTFSPSTPIQRAMNVAKMYAESKRFYPELSIYLNEHLNISDYFVLRDAYRNKDRKKVRTLAKQIIGRATTGSGWLLKCKALLHYFI